MRLTVCRVVAACLCAVAMSAVPAPAQPAVSSLSGRVVDPSGAAMPGASVVVRNTATGVEWSLAAGGDGRFQMLSLPPGSYEVVITARDAGFAPWRVSDLALPVGQVAYVDAELRVGGITEPVEVTAPERTRSSAIDGVLSARAIESLPLNGRNVLELARLVPGNQCGAR